MPVSAVNPRWLQLLESVDSSVHTIKGLWAIQNERSAIIMGSTSTLSLWQGLTGTDGRFTAELGIAHPHNRMFYVNMVSKTYAARRFIRR